MTLLDDIQEYFGTRCLYEVIGADKDSSLDQIKKCYRKSSLKIHPDRVDEAQKDDATKRFQALAQVHFVLSDEERRKLYDDHGIIANEDGLDSEADWSNYWRLLFPKVSESDINGFMAKYIDSMDEEEDLISIYNRFKGDLDKISATHISYDEERTVEQLRDLIEKGKIKKYDKFLKEPKKNKDARVRRSRREAAEAEEVMSKMKSKEKQADIGDLAAMIQQRRQGSFDSMIAGLEAKYANPKRTKQTGAKGKRKRTGD